MITQKQKTVITLLLLLFSSCSLNLSKNNNMQAIQFVPHNFHDVKLGVYETSINDCTPKNHETLWDEVAINVPKQIITTSIKVEFVMPLCGYYNITNKTSKLNVKKAGIYVYIFDINADEKVVYSGLVADFGTETTGVVVNEHPSPDPYLAEEDDQEIDDNSATGSAINVNVLKYVKCPIVPGKYEIYLICDGIESNHVQVELVVEK